MTRLNCFGRTDKGKVRSTNEDSFVILKQEPFYLFAVADGMGGHAAGEIASNLAITSIKDYLIDNLALLQSAQKEGDFLNFLYDMINKTNSLIWNASHQENQQKGMGTTLTVALFFEKAFFIGHIGDSRAYLVKEQDIKRLTQDHSLVEELIKNGEIDKEEAMVHPQKNVLTRALGTESEVEAEYYKGILDAGSTFFLFTDGLTSLISEEEILKISKDNTDEKTIVNTLIDMANERGGHDNITVVVIKD